MTVLLDLRYIFLEDSYTMAHVLIWARFQTLIGAAYVFDILRVLPPAPHPEGKCRICKSDICVTSFHEHS